MHIGEYRHTFLIVRVIRTGTDRAPRVVPFSASPDDGVDGTLKIAFYISCSKHAVIMAAFIHKFNNTHAAQGAVKL